MFWYFWAVRLCSRMRKQHALLVQTGAYEKLFDPVGDQYGTVQLLLPGGGLEENGHRQVQLSGQTAAGGSAFWASWPALPPQLQVVGQRKVRSFHVFGSPGAVAAMKGEEST
mmetsp:Transcript_93036/g.291125  ORF Transcript_93036/g.291125 Transcript_93036/m.291125 type:complete len:112 (+) Transcript_93036:231-566(+)